jgi:soluble lytic murein transglycosylase-like protein
LNVPRRHPHPGIWLAFLALPLAGQQPPPAGGVESSLARQRLSIETQVRSLHQSSFFLLPPIEPLGSETPATIACDPLPEDQISPVIDEAAKREGIQPELLRRVISQESGFRPCAVSAKGAQGLMQLMPATSAQLGVADAFDPRQNVTAGARYLKQLLTRYAGDVPKALAAYNAGPARVDQAGGVPSIRETLAYVSSILAALPTTW